ncbi:hypothetical protein FBEOM_10317 [Fusarium beomiforme]|uniref:Apple domain-containing protein n=1 Tax=Fusarium beomiforme TaxID=44412 RepID=A0A9P5ABZ9_9HYPO|nr:hypothetical protein FBEOM_10317 [Fusarium beomiforme]
MPSSKVFAAILAALAVANAGPCKPKPTTTSGSTAAVVTTSGTSDILSSTVTSGTAATTTTEAACSHYTPYTEIVPADCGKMGVAPNCADKVIGSPITGVDYASCGNTCGLTVGCKSFSIKGSTCTLYNAPVSSLGYVASEGADASAFYDLDLCFGCGEGSTTTSGSETSTGSETTTTGSATETSATGSETSATGSSTETSGTGSETGTTTTTTTGSETETSGTASATGTTDTETSATGSQTETTTATGSATGTTGTVSETGTTTASGSATETTETSATETLTANTDTTTAAATTTTSAGCTAYTPVANPPAASCNVQGAPQGPSAFFNLLAGLGDTPSANACALECANYHDATKPNDKCVSFSLDESHTCYLYKVPVSSLNVDANGTPKLELYDFEACYSCDEGGATTTAAESGSTSTEVESGSTTTEGSESTTTTAAGVDTTTTETASETGTTTTEVESGSSTTEAVGSTTTTEAGSDTTTTTAGVESSTTEAATTTTEAGVSSTTTTEAGTTTTTEAGVTTTTTEAGQTTATTTTEAGAGSTTTTESVAESTTTTEAGATTTTTEGGSESTTTTEAASTTTTEAGVGSTTTTEAASTTEASSSTEAVVGSTTTTEAGEASTTTTEAASTTEASSTTEAASTTTTEAQSTTTTEVATTTSAAPVCTNYVPLPNPPSTCGKQGKVSCRSNQKLGQSTSVTDVNACGKLCGTTAGCKTFSYSPKFRSAGGYCQLYSEHLAQLQFEACNTGVKFYDLDSCYTCSNTPTPTPPATCSKYVPAFEKCDKNTHCGTRGEICQEEKINVIGDASCLENCAKSCIQYGKDCKYFSYQPSFFNTPAKCTLYKSGKITKKNSSWVKFYEQDCFKCQQSK